MERVLGLDLGTNSVGWALIDVPTTDDETGKVVAMGSRVFPAGAEISGSVTVTKAKERRTKRSQRRQIARRSQRRKTLRRELTRLGLLPGSADEFERLMDVDPHTLLARAADGQQLSLREIGRFVYWMAGRRGFLSIRTGGSTVLDEDPDWVPTRYRLSQYDPVTGERVVQGQEDVLITVLESQQAYYPDLLTDKVVFGRRGRLTYPVRPIARDKYLSGQSHDYIAEFGLHGLVFFQRSVYWDKGTIGVCSLDPGSRQRRAARGERLSQRFILRQLLMNLRIGDDQRHLTAEERETLFALLDAQKTLAFSKVRKAIDLGEDTRINFERADSKGLTGNQVDPVLAKVLGDTWKSWPEQTKDELVYLLLGDATEEAVRTQLASRFGLDADQQSAVLNVTLPKGRMNFSRRTIRRLLPHMTEANDLREVIESAGFRTPEEVRAEKGTNLSTVTNPLVKSSLVQLGKVLRELNARFERADGTAFDRVRIELARDVSNSATIRDKIAKEQRQNKQQRDRAVTLIAEFAKGAEGSADSIRRARLYEEQGHFCLYCGKPISVTDLFSNRVQVDHILPRALTLDNSMGNVVLVHEHENLEKGDRTIFEWRGPGGVAEIAERARSMGLRFGKIRKIEQEHVDENHIPASLLASTSHITTLARDFVNENTHLDRNSIEVSRGRITAALLYRIGLTKDQGDHRRHAQDAAMVAISSPAVAKKLARRYKTERDHGARRDDDYGAWEPWEGFRNDILSVYATVITSHKPQRKNGGQLHEETNYGRVTSPSIPGDQVYARRRPLAAGFTRAQFDQIADPVIKRILVEDLARRGIDPAAAAKLTFDPASPPMFDGKAIKSVRCHANYPGHIVLRPGREPKTATASAGNHIAYVYTNTSNGRPRMVILNRLDSYLLRNLAERERRTKYALDGEEFLMSLCTSDVLRFTRNGGDEYWRVLFLDQSSTRLGLVTANDSIRETKWQVSITSLFSKVSEVRKVLVTPSGQIRRAND